MDPHCARFCARCGNPAPAWYRGGESSEACSCCHCGAEAKASPHKGLEEAESGSAEPPGISPRAFRLAA